MSAPGTVNSLRYGDVVVDRGLPVPMRDGTVLRADVWRPAGERGTLPALVSRQPYDRQQAQALTYAHPAWYARHGYAVVVQDVRGRWGSEGEWQPFVNEADDGHDTCAWVVEQPWCNGSVGMWGFSYAGATQLLAASTRPPGLAAIAPVHTASDYYEGWTYNGGAFALAFALPWAAFLGMDSARRAGDAAGERALLRAYENSWCACEALPLSEAEPFRSSGHTPYLFEWLEHESRDDYWDAVAPDRRYGEIEVPALHVAGWYDIFVDGGLRNFDGLRRAGAAHQKLLVGPWAHIPWTRRLGAWDFGTAGDNGIDAAQLAFFDTHLRGEGAKGDDVRVYVLRRGAWDSHSTWPPAGVERRELFLRSGGAANTQWGDGELSLEPPSGDEPPDIYTYDPAFPVPSVGGHSCCFAELAPIGPADQAPVEGMNGVLCYTSPPLARTLLLAGDIEVELWAQTSAADTDWAVKLCLVDAEGRSFNLREGIVRARHACEPGAPIAGEVRSYKIRLGGICAELSAGERLRLQVTSSNFPHWDRNLGTGRPPGHGDLSTRVVGTQAVYHAAAAPSRVSLPVAHGGFEGWSA